jgi:tyrosyl-tRNA synthetase
MSGDQGDFSNISIESFEKQFANTERTKVSRSELRDLASVVVKTGLRKTKADVRRLVPQNGLSINGQNISTEDEVIKPTGA